MLTAAVIAALAATAPAQLQFAELGKRHLPATQNTWSVAHGDVDGDGDQDLVLGQTGQNRLLLNDGSGVFRDATAVRMPLDNDFTRGVALGDIDGDGDLDIVCANQGTQDRIYRNDGTGKFTDVTTGQLPATNGSQSVSLADVDGDGDLDIALAAPDRLYLNNGSGSFVDVTATHLPAAGNSSGFAFADIDGDGDLDLACGSGGQNRLYVNSGNGVCTDVTASQLPSCWGMHVAFGDVDGDSDTDLVCGGYGQPQLLINNGAGSFTDVTASQMPNHWLASAGIELGDVDGDGDLDMVLANYPYSTSPQNRLFLNSGTGTFVDATNTRFPPDNEWTLAVALLDVDGDGDLDATFGNAMWSTYPVRWENQLLLNDGAGFFRDTTTSALPLDRSQDSSQALGDVDGDGDLDLVVGGLWQDRLCLNQGNGTFVDASATHLPSQSSTWTLAVALGDVDGDGDLDLVFDGQRLYLNNGLGVFSDVSAARMPQVFLGSRAIALGDVDFDGDLDMVLACGMGSGVDQDRLLLNNGAGFFTDVTATQMPVENDQSDAIALGDVDGDGDLDIVVGNADFGFGLHGQDRLFLNNGFGTFVDVTNARIPPANDQTTCLALGDIDGDGDLDLITGNMWEQNCLRLNNGGGFFTDATAARMPIDSDTTTSVAMGDIDEDGDLDLVFGTASNVRNRIYRNSGGVFTDVTTRWLPPDVDPTTSVALGDVDGDGDLDLAVAKSKSCFGGGSIPSCTGGQDRLYLNLQRQLDAPHLLRCGQPFTVDAYFRYGPAGTTDFAVAYLSTTRLSIPVPPFGTLGIDPVAPLPLIAIPQPAGVGSTTWNVPNAPALAGLPIYSQALLLNLPLQARLTNVTADVLIR